MAIPFFIATDIMLQTLILKLDLPKWMFPLVIAVSNLLIFVSINQSSKIAKWFPQNLGWSAILSFFPFILYGLFHSAWISLAGMIITILSRSTSVVEMAEFLNELPSSRQGIIESIFSTVLMLIVGGVSLLFGLLLKYYSFLFTNLMIGSLLVITYIVIAIFIARKN
jgi:hypothetical protein